MKKSKLRQIIRKEIKLLKESPDKISGIVNWSDAEAYPFGFNKEKDKCWIIKNQTHGDISWAYNNIDNEVPNDRVKFTYPGRLWAKEKIISFWIYPKKNELKKIIKLINNEAKKQNFKFKIDNSWNIEVIGHLNGKVFKKTELSTFPTGTYDSGEGEWSEDLFVLSGLKSIIIPVNKYMGSEKRTKKDLGKSHMLTPLLKQIKKLIKKKEFRKALDIYKNIDKKKYPELYELRKIIREEIQKLNLKKINFKK